MMKHVIDVMKEKKILQKHYLQIQTYQILLLKPNSMMMNKILYKIIKVFLLKFFFVNVLQKH